MKSDELMIEYKAQKVAAENVVRDETKLVKHMMAEYLELGLSVWLGEFCSELESAGEQDEFDFHPGGNYDSDACVKLLRVWRGIGVQIHVTAGKKKGTYSQTRGLKASMNFVWKDEPLWSGTLYRKEVCVELPFVGKDDGGKWVYVEAMAPVDARMLGETLVKALAVEEERNAARVKATAEREENKKWTHEREIERADDFGEMSQHYKEAMIAYPGDEERWRAAYEACAAELDKQRIAQKQLDAEVAQASAWLDNWRAVLDANREKLSQVQAQWSHPLVCYALEYGVVAEDEDVTKYIETRQMFVDNSAVDEHGNWFEVGRNKRCVRVNHPVRLWAMTFEHDGAVPNELIQKLWVSDCLEYIVIWVNDDVACAKADLAKAGFAEFPALNLSVSRSAWQRALRDGNYGYEHAMRQALEKLIDGTDLGQVA
jgi:hypothetical protein